MEIQDLSKPKKFLTISTVNFPYARTNAFHSTDMDVVVYKELRIAAKQTIKPDLISFGMNRLNGKTFYLEEA